MWKLWAIAARNLWRNPVRTLVTTAAISVGLAVMCLSVNLTAGQYRDMIRNGISQLAGHVVVQAEGWQEQREDGLRVSDSLELATTLRELFPEARVTRRSMLGGLLTAPMGSVGVAMTGFEPEAERPITELDDRLVEGEWLDVEDTRALVIGEGVAEVLQVGLGDKVVYMGQHGGEEVASRLFRVRGIVRTGSADMDSVIAVAHLEATQELMEEPGAAHQITVHLEDPERAEEAAQRVREAVGAPGLEVLSWRGAIPEIAALIEIDKASNHVILAILGVIVAMGVLNTILMSVLERTREFGVMLALGVSAWRVATVVLMEALLLGMMGATLGILLGCALSYPLVQHGLDYTEMLGDTTSQGGVVMSSVLYAAWDWTRMSVIAGLTLLFTMLAAVWPASRIASLEPVEAMRHV